MALIKCPECGKEISEFSTFCVGCGCPMDKIKEIIKEQKTSSQKLYFIEKLSTKNRELINALISVLKSKINYFQMNYKNYLAIGEGNYFNFKRLCYITCDKDDDLIINYLEKTNNERKQQKFYKANFNVIVKLIEDLHYGYEPNLKMSCGGSPHVANECTLNKKSYNDYDDCSFFIIVNDADGTYFESSEIGKQTNGRDDISMKVVDKYDIANFTSDFKKAYKFFSEEGANDFCLKLMKSFPNLSVKKIK